MSGRKEFTSPPAKKRKKTSPVLKAVSKLAGVPLNDVVVENIKSSLKLKRRICLEVVSSHFAAIGVIKQKPALGFYTLWSPAEAAYICQLTLRTKQEFVAYLTVSLDKMLEILASIVARFRKLRSVNIDTHDSVNGLTKVILDSLVSVASNYANMEIHRLSAIDPVDDVLLPSFLQSIHQFAGVLTRLTVHLWVGQFSQLNDAILALGLCQKLRHLDLRIFTDENILLYLKMLIGKMNLTHDTTVEPLSTTFVNVLTSLTHLRTLRLMGKPSFLLLTYSGKPYFTHSPHPATRHTLTISESWLSFACEPAFKAILHKMENFEMTMRDLPLSDENLALLGQIVELMPQSASISFFHHQMTVGSWLLTPISQLTNWLRLAKQTQKHIQIHTVYSLLTAEQLTAAMATLQIGGNSERKVISEQCEIYFQFGNGGRLTVKYEDLDDDSDDGSVVVSSASDDQSDDSD